MAIDPVTGLQLLSMGTNIANQYGGAVERYAPDNKWIKGGLTALGGPVAFAGGRDERENQERMDSWGGLDPAYERLMNSGAYADVMGGGYDPAYQQIAGSDAYNNLLSGGVDPAYDRLLEAQGTPAFQSMLRGEVDPRYNEWLTRSVGNRFGNIRSQVGAQLANRGLSRSTAGNRMLADTYNAERDALTGTLAQNQLGRMSFAHGTLGNTANSMAGNRLARLGLGYNTAGSMARNRLSRGALAGQFSSGIANNRLGRGRFVNDLMSDRNASQQQAGQSLGQGFGNLLEYNLGQEQLAAEQAKSINRPTLFPTVNPPGSQGKATSPMLSNNPRAGRSGGSGSRYLNPQGGLRGLTF